LETWSEVSGTKPVKVNYRAVIIQGGKTPSKDQLKSIAEGLDTSQQIKEWFKKSAAF
jgi:hypothetical protein